MIQFSTPSYLFALSSLLLPLAIHLLNRGAGKRIKVGSLDFLEVSQSQRFKSIKLNQIPLLLVRSAILLLLSLFLAQPVLIDQQSDAGQKIPGRVFFTPGFNAESLAAEDRKTLDSLIDAGHALHRLSADFPEIVFDQPGDLLPPLPSTDYWSLLREIDAMLPSDIQLDIFTSRTFNTFAGRRPTLRRSVQWYTELPTARQRFLVSARTMSADSFAVTSGTRDGDAITFSRSHHSIKDTVWSFPSSSDSFRLQHAVTPVANPALRYKNHGATRIIPIRPAPAALTLCIVADTSRYEDARYVSTAAKAAASFFQLPLKVIQLTPDAEPALHQKHEMVFWLSGEQWHPSILTDGSQLKILIEDGVGEKYAQGVDQFLIPEQNKKIMVHRRSANQVTGTPLWHNAEAATLLSIQTAGQVQHFQFGSRFHPMWSDLVLSDSFPHWIGNMLQQLREAQFGAATQMNGFGQNLISRTQMAVRRDTSITLPAAKKASTSLQLPLFIAILFLFAAERIWSERKKL